MAINFPTSLDALTNPTATDQVAVVSHADQHANANDAIEALEAKVGINGSAVTTSHDYKLGEVTGSDKAVSKTATQTLTNKTLTSPVLDAPTINNAVSPSFTTPRITTSINDSNGNEIIRVNPIASAVNEVRVSNSTTGNDVLIDAAGGDTNISLEVKGKGTGRVKLGTAELQFPNTDGSNLQVLATNGAADLTWRTVSSERFIVGGDGSDGALSISSGTTTLTRDMYYTTVSVTGTAILNTANFRVFARTSITVDATSGAYIGMVAGNGGNGGNATGVAGGTAGTAGTVVAEGSLPAGVAGQVGGAGVGDVNGLAGGNGTSINRGAGSNGSAGGNGNRMRTATQGAGGTAGVRTNTAINVPRSYSQSINPFDFTSATAIQRILTSAGSGGGGGANGANSGFGGGGGGSGASGGWVRIETPSLVLTGVGAIRNNGGNGGNGGNGNGDSGVNGGGGGGGGGGGAGGVIVCIYNAKSGTGTITANGGTGGTKGTNTAAQTTAGSNGTAGNAGVVYEIKVTE